MMIRQQEYKGEVNSNRTTPATESHKMWVGTIDILPGLLHEIKLMGRNVLKKNQHVNKTKFQRIKMIKISMFV